VVAKRWSRATRLELLAGGDRWSRTTDGNGWTWNVDRCPVRSLDSAPVRRSWLMDHHRISSNSDMLVGLAVGIHTTKEEPPFDLDAC
jgi:hypothetical protein